MIQTLQIILDPATVYTLNATPKIALPAPPAGFVNNILGISHDMAFVSAAYVTATKLIYGVSDSSSVFQDSNVMPAVANVNLPAIKTIATQTVFSTTKDLYVTTDHIAATGDSTINGYIVFEQIQIGA